MEETKNDAFAYLERNDFTSEKYKIEIRGLPKFYGFGELKRLVSDTLKLDCSKVKPPRRGCSWAYACLRSEEERTKAIALLNGYKWKKATLSATIAQAAPDPLVNKRKAQGETDEPAEKRPKTEDDNLSSIEKVKRSATPYWNKSYEEQKKCKWKDMRGVLLELAKILLKVNPDLTPWILHQRNKYNGMICPLEDVQSVDQINGYRNKCEFAIGINSETKLPTVGFRMGKYNEGSVHVGSVDELLIVSDRMKEVAKAMEKFVVLSEKPPYDHETHEGYWRQLTVRVGSATGEVLIVVGFHPQNLSETELKQVKSDIVEYFTKGDGSSLKINSLYFQSMALRQAGTKQPKMEHLWGGTHIHDVVLGVKFRISPEAFFQINTAACEKLYSTIGDIAGLTPNTALVDVCCGAGTIGLCLAKRCKRVFGIELVEQAVEDAKHNAELNNITNSEFFVGRAEDILDRTLVRASFNDVVAVVDPPRAGLHQKAVLTLRKTRELNRLVYASCDPKAATKNFIDLGRQASKKMKGHPFVPVRAIPVDMFPHTKICELIIYFERIDVNQIEKLIEGDSQNIPVESEEKDVGVKIEEKEVDGKTEEKEVDGKTEEKEVDGKTEEKEVDGKTEEKDEDVKMEPSEERRESGQQKT